MHERRVVEPAQAAATIQQPERTDDENKEEEEKHRDGNWSQSERGRRGKVRFDLSGGLSGAGRRTPPWERLHRRQPRRHLCPDVFPPTDQRGPPPVSIQVPAPFNPAMFDHVDRDQYQRRRAEQQRLGERDTLVQRENNWRPDVGRALEPEQPERFIVYDNYLHGGERVAQAVQQHLRQRRQDMTQPRDEEEAISEQSVAERDAPEAVDAASTRNVLQVQQPDAGLSPMASTQNMLPAAGTGISWGSGHQPDAGDTGRAETPDDDLPRHPSLGIPLVRPESYQAQRSGSVAQHDAPAGLDFPPADQEAAHASLARSNSLASGASAASVFSIDGVVYDALGRVVDQEDQRQDQPMIILPASSRSTTDTESPISIDTDTSPSPVRAYWQRDRGLQRADSSGAATYGHISGTDHSPLPRSHSSREVVQRRGVEHRPAAAAGATSMAPLLRPLSSYQHQEHAGTVQDRMARSRSSMAVVQTAPRLQRPGVVAANEASPGLFQRSHSERLQQHQRAVMTHGQAGSASTSVLRRRAI